MNNSLSHVRRRRAPAGVDRKNRIAVSLMPDELIECSALATAEVMTHAAFMRRMYLDGVAQLRKQQAPQEHPTTN